MRHKDIEDKLRGEIRSSAPDVWDKIESKLQESPQAEAELVTSAGTTVGKKKINPVILTSCFAVFAAAVALVICLLNPFRSPLPSIAYSETGYILMDINPSVQLILGSDGKVKEVKALNADAQVMLSGQYDKFVGLSDEDAASEILKTAISLGYISAERTDNAVLVSAGLDDRENERRLESKIRSSLKSDFMSYGIYGVVITDTKQSDTAELAEKYGITESKMRLILQAEGMGVTFTEEEKTSVSVSEIYSRMSDRAEILEKLLSPEIEEEYERLTELSEDLLEDLTDSIEDLLEQIEEYDDAEDAVEKMEDTLDAIEDAREHGREYLSLFESIYAELDSVATSDEELTALIDQIKQAIKAQVDAFSLINDQIEESKNSLLTQHEYLAGKYGNSLRDHEKDDDFDDLFEDWFEDAAGRYESEWSKLKEEWERRLEL